jgi:hypothetical protein
MNRIESFLIGLACGIATLYLMMHFTIVRANDGFHWIPKLNAKLDLPYEDVRDFNAEHWQRRPALTMSIVRARKSYLIDNVSRAQVQQTTQQVVNQTKLRSTSNALLAGSNPSVR